MENFIFRAVKTLTPFSDTSDILTEGNIVQMIWIFHKRCILSWFVPEAKKEGKLFLNF